MLRSSYSFSRVYKQHVLSFPYWHYYYSLVDQLSIFNYFAGDWCGKFLFPGSFSGQHPSLLTNLVALRARLLLESQVETL